MVKTFKICGFEFCQINMRIKNLNNKRIIKINDLKF